MSWVYRWLVGDVGRAFMVRMLVQKARDCVDHALWSDEDLAKLAEGIWGGVR